MMEKICALLLLLAFVGLCASVEQSAPLSSANAIKFLDNLKTIYEKGYISESEYKTRKAEIIDHYTGIEARIAAPPANGTIYSPQLKFLLNQMHLGLPRSYQDVLPDGSNYWVTSAYLDIGAVDPFGNHVPLDSEIAIQERTLSRYGLNLYDGATWEIALTLAGLGELVDVYERNVLYCSGTGSDDNVGGIIDVRADAEDYLYGNSKIGGNDLTMITLPGNCTRVIGKKGKATTETSKKIAGAFFYRMIGPKYLMTDPFDGDYANAWKYPYPNNDTTTPWNIGGLIHWNDWKPITGENVWAAILGPIQSLWIRNGTNTTNFLTYKDTPAQVQLALSVLPALVALQSSMGSLYHCPDGTEMFPPDPSESTNVSNENNFSGYAALTMLLSVLKNKTHGTSDPILTGAISDLTMLVQGLDKWFDTQILSGDFQGYKVIYQGGHVSGTTFKPAPLEDVGGFAVDCQTWGMTVLGQARIDRVYGAGTAYQIWQATKKFAGYYNPAGELGGVGYTLVPGDKNITTHTIWSAEWTWGAINMCKKLSYEYQKAGNGAYAAALKADADSMIRLVSQKMVRCPSGKWCGGGLVQEDGAYLYANDRFFIPWGWYANPIGATCSTAWAVMNDFNFNPFVLGGGNESPLTLEY